MTLFPIVKAPAWTEDAACVGHPPDLFFPDIGGSATEAKAICAGCTVKAECLALAQACETGTARSSRFGVYAGLSPNERAELHRRSA